MPTTIQLRVIGRAAIKSPKKYFRLSTLILSLLILLLTHSPIAQAQNRSRKSRTQTDRKQTLTDPKAIRNVRLTKYTFRGYNVLKTTYGDLDGDGVEEAAVTIELVTDTGHRTSGGIEVFRWKDGRVVRVTKIRTIDWILGLHHNGAFDISIDDGILTVVFIGVDGEGCFGCFDYLETSHYKLLGGSLVKVGDSTEVRVDQRSINDLWRQRQTSAKRTSSSEAPAKNEQELAIDRLLKSAASLESSYANRSSTNADGFDTRELSMAAEHAIEFVKSESIKAGISQMVQSYKDAMALYGLAQDRGRNPRANSYSDADRERDVKEIKDLKDRLYKNYDDPISRDQLRAQIDLKETMMRLKYHEQSQEEDPLAKRVRQRKIDARAKRILGSYGLQDEWPENTFIVVDRVFGVGKKTAVSIRECIKQPDSCAALAAEAQEFSEKSAQANVQPNVPANSLVGIWMLEYTWGPNGAYKTPFEVEKQSDKYVASFGELKVTDIVMSGNNFAFTFSFRPAISLDNSNLRTATVSGTVEGDRITGQFMVHAWSAGGYNIPAETYPLTGTRLAP